MSAYCTVGTNKPEMAAAFYDATLPLLGWALYAQFPGWRGYSPGGSGDGFKFWVCAPFDGAPASVGNGAMTGFMTDTPAKVDAFYAAAIANGGADEGPPGVRAAYGPKWYAAYMRDPDGNKISVVCFG